MSELDILDDAVERLEWDERKEEDTPVKRWRQVTRRTALSGGAAGVAAAILEACGSSSKSTSSASAAGSSGAASVFGSSQAYKFTMVNHVTTNPFFTPTQNGASDACKLLGCSYQWTGSQTSNVSEMVNALNSAVSAGVNGIAVSLVDLHAFNAPVSKAISSNIPVVAYNADVPNNARLAYIGQDLRLSGEEMGTHIASLVPSGDVALFIATPGALNIQPRIDGALATLKKHPSITTHVVATGAALPQELTTIQAYAQGHPNTKGMFAVDAGSTQGVAQTIQKQGLKGKVMGGGYDLLGPTEQLLAAGYIQFTIDQQAYLQGFIPIQQMYMYQATQKLTGIADVNTGLKFLDQTTIKPYVTTKSRYEGTATGVGVQKA
ncbi:MAG: sugar ABC transporter substrate-binding protein [Solirubrobacterales bacterium]|nr:sugar ABC transporter substrate-binding protein [Solirubrobacterales bacterium]MBV9915611.1 sugar ABC transporter substrate-binding protein [Solirubrobacterales bacterium]